MIAAGRVHRGSEHAVGVPCFPPLCPFDCCEVLDIIAVLAVEELDMESANPLLVWQRPAIQTLLMQSEPVLHATPGAEVDEETLAAAAAANATGLSCGVCTAEEGTSGPRGAVTSALCAGDTFFCMGIFLSTGSLACANLDEAALLLSRAGLRADEGEAAAAIALVVVTFAAGVGALFEGTGEAGLPPALPGAVEGGELPSKSIDEDGDRSDGGFLVDGVEPESVARDAMGL